MFDVLVRELAERYGLGDRSRDLFGLLMGYIYNDRRGGFGGFAEGFRQQGQGELFASWLGGDPRRQRAANASEIGMVFGQGLLADWGNRVGASRATVAAAIAGILPRLIGELTPGGRMPEPFGATAAPVGIARRENDAAESAPPAAPRFEEGPDAVRAASAARAPEREPTLRREDRPRRASDYDDEIVPIDPHVAAINAAVSAPAPTATSKISDMPLRDFEFRRPAADRGSRWWLWLLILLALAAGGYYFGRDYLSLDGLRLPSAGSPSNT